MFHDVLNNDFSRFFNIVSKVNILMSYGYHLLLLQQLICIKYAKININQKKFISKNVKITRY